MWHQRGQPTRGRRGALPPPTDPTGEALDLARYWEDKQRFLAHDQTARYLGAQIAAPEPEHRAGRPAGRSPGSPASLTCEPCERFLLALAMLPGFDSAAGAIVAACVNDPAAVHPTLALAQRLWDEPVELLTTAESGHRLERHGLLERPQRDTTVDWRGPLVHARARRPDAAVPVCGPAGPAPPTRATGRRADRAARTRMPRNRARRRAARRRPRRGGGERVHDGGPRRRRVRRRNRDARHAGPARGARVHVLAARRRPVPGSRRRRRGARRPPAATAQRRARPPAAARRRGARRPLRGTAGTARTRRARGAAVVRGPRRAVAARARLRDCRRRRRPPVPVRGSGDPVGRPPRAARRRGHARAAGDGVPRRARARPRRAGPGGRAALRPRRAHAAAQAGAAARRDRPGDGVARRGALRVGHGAGWNEGGLAALFAGPPGTGKTMAAEVLAARARAAALPHRPLAGRQQVHRRDREEPPARVRRRRRGRR